MRAMMLLASGMAAASAACSAPPPEWAPLGDASYRAATVCTSAELAPVMTDAAERWRAADPEIRLNVRVDAEALDAFPADPSCQISARYVHALPASGGEFVGLSAPGRMQLLDDPEFAGLMSDTVTHELGHFLLGLDDVAHSDDPESVMFAFIDMNAGEKAILPSDLAKLDASAR